jgi:hypothetical protein
LQVEVVVVLVVDQSVQVVQVAEVLALYQIMQELLDHQTLVVVAVVEVGLVAMVVLDHWAVME